MLLPARKETRLLSRVGCLNQPEALRCARRAFVVLPVAAISRRSFSLFSRSNRIWR